ncbi:MAG: phosphodiester glycosidase family protein [Bacteroidales bacterium]|nr:phosphodiester glycosidase family protein [Bacteroidales bacterium]
MKLNRILMFVAAVIVFGTACNPYKIEIPHWPYEDPDWVDDGTGSSGWDPVAAASNVVYPDAGGEKTQTLLTTSGWSSTTIEEGLVFHHFKGRSEDANNDNQDVYVLELDLDNPNYRLYFHYGSNTTSGAASNLNAIAAVNGTYELEAVYVRTQGVNRSEVKLASNHQRFWKHGGAIVGGDRRIAMVNGSGPYKESAHTSQAGEYAIELYKNLKEPNIFAAAPMLIDDYDPVGERFVPEGVNVNSYEKEDAFGHQGNRHPRTAYALTADNDLLLVVVDGRTSTAKGMTAKELTRFLKRHFNPRWAVNMDGGGSSAMYIKGHGSKDKNDIVNNFTDTDDNGKLVERSVSTHLIIQKYAAN